MQMKPNKTTIMHSTFATKSTVELKELLKSDCMATDAEKLDIDTILYIMEVIDEREQAEGILCHDEEALTPQEAQADFYATHFPDYTPTPALNSSAPVHIRKKKPMRRIYFLVAVLVAVMACSVSASAFEVNLFQLFAQWTEETFQFVAQVAVGVAEEDEDDPLSELRELVKVNTDLPLVPHWCPDGFEVTDTQEYPLTSKTFITTTLINNNDVIIITITHHKLGIDAYAYLAEKKSEDTISFDSNGITHYFLMNSTTNTATWVYDDFVCEISGNITPEEMECMIESIYKG